MTNAYSLDTLANRLPEAYYQNDYAHGHAAYRIVSQFVADRVLTVDDVPLLERKIISTKRELEALRADESIAELEAAGLNAAADLVEEHRSTLVWMIAEYRNIIARLEA